jgi:membrane protein implicated in regulation of membrane protease activity
VHGRSTGSLEVTSATEMTILRTLGSALAVSAAVYLAVQWIVLARGARNLPGRPLHGSAALVGRKAEVATPFLGGSASVFATGNVRLDGETWRAELAPDAQPPPTVGEAVQIVGVAGLLLRVTRC